MPHIRWSGAAACAGAALILAACGSSPTSPGPPAPPVTCASLGNTPPVIDTIGVQGSRAGEPASFADLNEAIAITATVHDQETAADRLQYVWSATAGTFSGSGTGVTWQAPAAAATPLTVTLTLHVIEQCGTGQSAQHDVTGTAAVSLHDSAKEVGDMATVFLQEFSDSSLTDVDHIMRNFSKAACPDPREIDSEFDDVRNNRAKFRIVSSRIGTPVVLLAFGGHCPFPGPDPNRRKAGDACAIVPSYWDSIDLSDNSRGAVDGKDYLAAAYSAGERRWWLCSSDYDGTTVSGVSRRGFIR